MTDRLYRLLARIEQLPANDQDEMAEQFEVFAELYLRKVVEPISLPRPSYAGIWSDLPNDMMERYADIRHSLRPPQGLGLIGDIDTLIAATTLEAQ